MITTAFIYTFWFFLFVLTSPLRILDDASISASVLSGISFAAQALASLVDFFPLTITSIIASVAIVIVIENFHFIYKGIMWVIHLIRGSG